MKSIVENIVDLTDDPIECATHLQRHLNKLPEDARYLESFHGLRALSYKFYGPYKETRPLEITANGGYGLLDNDARDRSIEEQRFDGQMRIMGRLATFDYTTLDGDSSIVLRVSRPQLVDTHLINDAGNPATNFVEQLPVPTFAITGHFTVPILNLLRYSFAPAEDELKV